MDSETMNNSVLTRATLLLKEHKCKELLELLSSVNTSSPDPDNVDNYPSIYEYFNSLCSSTHYQGIEGLKRKFFIVILSCLLIFGLVGNILSAIIMFKRSSRGLSSYFYLGYLAIMDVCVLYSGCLSFFLEIGFKIDIKLISDFNCQIISFIQHLSTYISAWLIVAVTFERFIVVRFPFQSIRICRVRVANIISLSITILFTLYSIHGFFTIRIHETYIRTQKIFDQNFRICELLTYPELFSTIDLCLYSVAPSLFIIVLNSLIIYTMFYAMKQRRNFLQASSGIRTTDTYQRQLEGKNRSTSSVRSPFFGSRSNESTQPVQPLNLATHTTIRSTSQQKSRSTRLDSTSATGIRLTCLLLVISFVFVYCTLPISIRGLLRDHLSKDPSTDRWQMTSITLTTLMYLNHTINFALYCLTGRAFRRECRKLLCGLWTLKTVQISLNINRQPVRLENNQRIRFAQRVPMTKLRS